MNLAGLPSTTRVLVIGFMICGGFSSGVGGMCSGSLSIPVRNPDTNCQE